jgi:hypothetical protein
MALNENRVFKNGSFPIKTFAPMDAYNFKMSTGIQFEAGMLRVNQRNIKSA